MDAAARPDVFISYAREDHAAAARLAQWCAGCGWAVWWDQAIVPGRKWDQAIETALADARCVLVLWSAASVRSDWVKTEAGEGTRRGVLVPVQLDGSSPPLEFRRVQTLDLAGWQGDADAPALALLRSGLAAQIGAAAAAASSSTSSAPSTPPAGRSGAELVALAEAQCQALHDKAEASSLYWPALLREEGGRQLLEQAVLLAAEAVRRGGGDAAQAALRRTLVLQTQPLRRLQHDDLVTALDAAPDGRTLATASNDWTAALWDSASGARIAVLHHDDPVDDIAFGHNRRWLATASRDGTVRLWQAADGAPLLRLEHDEAVRRIALSADGRLLAALPGSGLKIHLWSLPDGRALRTIRPDDWQQDIAVSDDGRYVIGRRPGTSVAPVQVWAVDSGAAVAAPAFGPFAVESLATHGDLLAVGERGGSEPVVSLWRLGSWEALGRVRGLRGSPVVALSADGRQLAIGATAARYGQVFSAAVAAGAVRAVSRSGRCNDGIRHLVISADGSLAAATAQDGTATVVDLRGGAELLRVEVSDRAQARPVLAPDMRWLLTSAGSAAELWDIAPADLLAAARLQVPRGFTDEEWQHWFPGEPRREGACHL